MHSSGRECTRLAHGRESGGSCSEGRGLPSVLYTARVWLLGGTVRQSCRTIYMASSVNSHEIGILTDVRDNSHWGMLYVANTTTLRGTVVPEFDCLLLFSKLMK